MLRYGLLRFRALEFCNPCNRAGGGIAAIGYTARVCKRIWIFFQLHDFGFGPNGNDAKIRAQRFRGLQFDPFPMDVCRRWVPKRAMQRLQAARLALR